MSTAAWAAGALVVGYLLGVAATRALWRRAMRTMADTCRAAFGDDDDDVARAIKALAVSLDGLGGRK